MQEVSVDTANIISAPDRVSNKSAKSSSFKPDAYFEENDMAFFSSLSALKRVENPFAHRDSFGCCEVFKLLFAVILVPIRIILLLFSLLLLYPFIIVATITCCGCNSPQKPPNCLQKFVWKLYYPFTRTVLFCFGVWHVGRIKGSKRVRAQVIVAAPHSSFLDVFVLGYINGAFSGFGKQGVTKLPLLGRAAKLTRTILIDRSSPEARAQSKETYLFRLTEESKLNPIKYVTFPEGTCTNRKKLLSFRQGAFAASVPVQLVTLHWKSTSSFDVSWTAAGPSRGYLFLRMLMQPYTKVSYKISEVIEPEENEDPTEVAQRVEKLASETLNIPVSNHTFKDSLISKHAKMLGLMPDDACDFAINDFEKVGLKLNLSKTKKILDRFSLCCGRKGNKCFLDLEGFSQYFHIPLDAVKNMFFTICGKVHNPEADVDAQYENILKLSHTIAVMTHLASKAERAALSVTEVEAGLRLIEGPSGMKLKKKWGEFVESFEGENFLQQNLEILYVWSKVVINLPKKIRN